MDTIGCGAGNLLHSLRSLRKLPAPQPPDANTFPLALIQKKQKMSKITLIAIILTLFSACISKTDNEAVKLESKRLTEKLKTELAQCKVEVEQLNKTNNNLQNQLTELKEEKNQLKYTVTNENDSFWRRGVIYESPDKNEKLFNAKCIEIRDTLRFFFFSAKRMGEAQGDKDSVLVKLYEYVPKVSGQAKEIDRFNCFYDWEYDYFFLGMESNITFNGGKMYYHTSFDNKKIHRYNCCQYSENKHYEYDILRHSKVDTVKFQDISSYFNKYGNYTISENNNMIAQHGVSYGDIVFYTYPPQLDKREAYLLIDNSTDGYPFNETYNENGIQEQFRLHDIDNNNELLEAPHSSYALGYLSWNYEGNCLFFCNSNIELACIWKLDIQNRSISRIVPEHDAIHPFYFEYQGRSVVIYVEKNKLMVCESPN